VLSVDMPLTKMEDPYNLQQHTVKHRIPYCLSSSTLLSSCKWCPLFLCWCFYGCCILFFFIKCMYL